MGEIIIREITPTDYHSIAAMIVDQNRNPETHCIQSTSTDDPIAIAEEIKDLYAKNELRFMVAEHDGKIIGCMGCEFDEGVGRGWTRGPFLINGLWESPPAPLFQKLLATLPANIRRLDSFLNEKHEQGNRFYLENGFKHKTLVHVYQADAANWSDVGLEFCPEIEETQTLNFITLHDATFPNTFINGLGILEQLDDDHKIFIYTNGPDLGGYIYLSVDKFGGEGYIEFIAVQSDLRGKGIGYALLQCALNWCFSKRKLTQVGLTVSEELTNAQSLYTKVGFRLLYTGVNTCLEWYLDLTG
jgi:ribosomal protein S18 acetylase RimI-like enzyme